MWSTTTSLPAAFQVGCKARAALLRLCLSHCMKIVKKIREQPRHPLVLPTPTAIPENHIIVCNSLPQYTRLSHPHVVWLQLQRNVTLQHVQHNRCYPVRNRDNVRFRGRDRVRTDLIIVEINRRTLCCVHLTSANFNPRQFQAWT